MRIWLACFGVLFATAELLQWAKHLTLPLPIFILGGAFLAIASNYNKLEGLLTQDSSAEPPSAISSEYSPKWDELSESRYNQAPSTLNSISFTIKRASEQNRLDETKKG